jgi:hypothetical protein
MSAGITKVHGTVIAPSQRPSTLTFFQIDFGVNMTAEVGLVNGALEKAINVCSNFATVAMIGTLNATGGTGEGLRIAIEDTGVGTYAPSGLGMGEPNDYATTALALQAAIRALGDDVGPNSIDLTGAAVTLFTL